MNPQRKRQRSSRARQRLATGLGALLWCALVPSAATAHLGHVVQRAERYLKLDVSGHQVRLVVSLSLGASETARLMQEADSDADGIVTEPERDQFMASWGEGLRVELPVTVDGRSVDVRFGDAFMQPLGAISARDGSVEMVGVFELEGGEQEIVVRDGMRTETFDRTDLSFRARDGARLIASGVGPLVSEPLEQLSMRGGTSEAPELRMRVHATAPPPRTAEERSDRMDSGRFGPWLVLGGIGCLALAFIARRRARR